MKRAITLVLALVLAMASANSGGRLIAGAAPAPQEPEGISPEALAQIEALIREKESRTGPERKMDSQLVYELKMAHGEAVAAGVRTVETDVEYTFDDRLVLDVRASVTEAFLDELRAQGYTIVAADTQGGTVRLLSETYAVAALAAMPEVSFVQPKRDAITSRASATPAIPRRRFERDLLRRSALRAYLQSSIAQSFGDRTGVGSVSSQGDVTHLAFAARGAFGINGAGVKIGVLSDGVTNLAASQALGDLGPVNVLSVGSGDEGTAMLEIIHDLAPGAELYFATANGGITTFANNIRALRSAGCDIIVDDIFYFVESPFQDGQTVVSDTNGGVVTQAVNDVTASGALYFSAAGNSGNLNDGTSGVWEGDFVDGGPTGIPLPVGRLHQFRPGQNFNTLTAAGMSGAMTTPINLYWSDPLAGSSNDYDLFRLNSSGTAVAAASTNPQTGTQDPYEQISSNVSNPRIVIVKKTAAAARFLHLNTNRGRLSIATAGQTHGHSAAAAAYSVGATAAMGPYPNPFSASDVVERFSSDGPRRLFFDPAGVPFTPGDLSSTGGLLRQKPDVTAADGVSVTGVGGFTTPFVGTSAAAPHAAAIAALIKSANPSLSPAEIRAALTSTAIDIEAAGVDRDAGFGIVMPIPALQAIGATGTAYLAVFDTVASEHPGNGNGVVNVGEGASLSITVRNVGVQEAIGISGALSTTTPGVTLTLPASSPYPDLPAYGGTGTNASPLLFTVASNAPCPLPIDFSLTLTYSGRVQTIPMRIDTGPGPVTVTTTLDAAPPLGPWFTGTTGMQISRMFRDGVASTCTPKPAFPGAVGTSLHRYDAFTVNECAEASSSCVAINISGTSAINLFSAAYSPTFVPTNIATNYKADAGSSASSRTYALVTPGAGGQFAINVHDVTPGSGAGPVTYTLSITGACAGAPGVCATPNQVPIAKVKNVTVSADASCTAAASIDDGSYDPDGDPVTITQSPAGPYPIGTTTVLLTITDTFGATDQKSATVTVVDTTAPSIGTVTASPSELWPANHKMIPVVIDYSVSDNCSPDVSCTLTVTSNEPSGVHGGGKAVDWEVIDDHHVLLRAERSGTGTGRIYTITVTCTDGSGNTSVKTTTVSVPHSR